MSDSNRRTYDKLVRDRMPEIIRGNDEEPIVHRANDVEYYHRLLDKLQEEVDEYVEEPSVEELADIYEVLEAIVSYSDTMPGEVAGVQAKKLAERGGFEERIVLDRVE